MKDTLKGWSSEHLHFSSKDAMDLLLLTQYTETLVAIGSNQLIVRPQPAEIFAVK